MYNAKNRKTVQVLAYVQPQSVSVPVIHPYPQLLNPSQDSVVSCWSSTCYLCATHPFSFLLVAFTFSTTHCTVGLANFMSCISIITAIAHCRFSSFFGSLPTANSDEKWVVVTVSQSVEEKETMLDWDRESNGDMAKGCVKSWTFIISIDTKISFWCEMILVVFLAPFH